MTRRWIKVIEADQILELYEGKQRVDVWPVSTSALGTGTAPGSNRTPLGRHRICEKIGAGLPLGAILVSREWTGRFWRGELNRDYVLTRILWLDGVETWNTSSRSRFIYIHGTNWEHRIGERLPLLQRCSAWIAGRPVWQRQPRSHGCVRMRNRDVVDLFDRVEVNDEVMLVA